MDSSLASAASDRPVDLQVGSEHGCRQVTLAGGPRPRVALVRPPLMFAEGAVGNEIVPSIGLAYINGYLRKFGYEPLLFDGQAEAHNRVTALPGYPGYHIQGATLDEMLAAMPDGIRIFGISAMFSAEWPITRDLINRIRQRYPEAVIVAGGEHVTAIPEYCLRDCAGLDVCVRGEGEHVFLELCDAIAAGLPLSSIPGIAFLDDGGQFVQSSAVTRIRNIDVIPWPHWPEGYLERFWESGKSFGVRSERDMPILMTRGCPYQCTFCSNKDMWTTRYVMRSIDDIIDEVRFYYEKYRVTSFQIYDLTAITKKKWFIELLERLVALDLPVEWSFPSGTRSEILDADILRLLKQVHTSYLCYAPESGSPETLRKIKKQVDLPRMMQSIYQAKRIGLVVRTNFVIGFPDETRRDIARTFLTALKCAIHGVDDLQPYLFNPYPGSELFNECVRHGQVTINDAYFLSISRQNSDLFNFRPVTFNQSIPNWELAIWRLVMTMSCYGISYLFFPWRILRTIGNVGWRRRADTVFEARLRGLFARKKVRT